jgi:hypothetical protein
MRIRILLNECEPLTRGGESIYPAGTDDAHYYRVDNIEKAASSIVAVRTNCLPEITLHHLECCYYLVDWTMFHKRLASWEVDVGIQGKDSSGVA